MWCRGMKMIIMFACGCAIGSGAMFYFGSQGNDEDDVSSRVDDIESMVWDLDSDRNNIKTEVEEVQESFETAKVIININNRLHVEVADKVKSLEYETVEKTNSISYSIEDIEKRIQDVKDNADNISNIVQGSHGLGGLKRSIEELEYHDH